MVGLVIKYRDEQILKYSQVNFLCIILSGAILLSFSLFFIIADPTPFICGFYVWLGHLGYSLMLGTLYVKTWRVDKIFNNKQLKTLRISDKMMYIRLGVLCVSSLIALIIMTAVDPFHVVYSSGGTTTKGIITYVTYYKECSQPSTWILSLLLAVQIIILGLGALLAYKTRNVADAFREAKSIFLAIYCVILVGLIAIFLIYGIALNPNAYMAVLVVAISLCTFVVVSVLMIPKFYVILYGNNESGESKTGKYAVTGASMSTQANQTDTLTNLVEINNRLAGTLIEKNEFLEMKKFVIQAGKETVLQIKRRQFTSRTEH